MFVFCFLFFFFFFFFFQAEDGIRDHCVTGVQTCALPILATLRDVTEEKQAQDTLARSEARYRNLFESASDAIATFDANGRFTTFNHAAEIISGYRREEQVGQWFAPKIGRAHV